MAPCDVGVAGVDAAAVADCVDVACNDDGATDVAAGVAELAEAVQIVGLVFAVAAGLAVAGKVVEADVQVALIAAAV